MVKKQSQVVFVCSDCGNEFSRWAGQCVSCGGWNTLKETLSLINRGNKKVRGLGIEAVRKRIVASGVIVNDIVRMSTGWREFDRVLGGELNNLGLVEGAVVLLTGEPGIGKSTILSQLAMNVATKDFPVLYVSGEESVNQIGLRLKRLAGEKNKSEVLDNVELISNDDVDYVISNINEKKWGLVIVDSIQTMQDSNAVGSSGSVGQIKECASKLIMTAKAVGTPMVLVGHVTKDGSIAGPRLLEHMVDVVLYFEGDKQTSMRLLRGIKNRYGSTDEVGVFVMESDGLGEQGNYSDMFITESSLGVPGSALSVVMEGSRPLIIEIQALVSVTQYPAPRRVVTGYDYNRVMTIVAILMQHCGLRLENKDIYVNVVGGISLDDPGVDLAVAVAIASCAINVVAPKNIVFTGELGLSGEVRRVKDMRVRVKEVVRLGYGKVVGPSGSDLLEDVIGVSYLRELLKKFGLLR